MNKAGPQKNARLPRREKSPLPLMLTPTGLAVGLEPPSVPDAAGTVSPNPSPEFWVPRWPVRRTIKQTKNCMSLDTRLIQVKQLPKNYLETNKKIVNNNSTPFHFLSFNILNFAFLIVPLPPQN
jgi:hypothetical protein